MLALGWWRRAAALAVLLTLLAPAIPWVADTRVLAHAQLVASSPGAGAVVPESPPELRLVFSEPLEAQATSVDVVAQDGTALLTRAGEVDPSDPYALVVSDPGLPDGVYSLTWRTLSAADGHTAEGFFTFGVGDVSVVEAGAGGPGAMTHDEADPLRVIGRWLTYLGLLLALGVSVFHRLVIRDGPMPPRLVQLLAAGLGVSAIATLAAAIGAALEAGSVPDYLLGTRNGALQLARAGVAAAGAAAMLLVAGRHASTVAIATGMAGIVLLVAAGHAAALPGPVPMLAQVVHVAAAGIWIGGLITLAGLQLRPALVTGSGRRPAMRSLVPRFSALALVSIGLVSLTGVYAAWVQTGTLVTTDTDYGRTLIAKSALALAAFALGGLNYFDGGRMLGWLSGFRNRTWVEGTTALAVLAATAILATTPPVDEAGGVPIDPIPDAFGAVAPGMEMAVVPGRPGVNRVVVTTTDAMAAANLELSLDRIDTGSTTRVPLTMTGMPAGHEMPGMDHGAMQGAVEDGTIEWSADALVLPPASSWDTAVRIVSDAGTELTRQRFAFSMSDDGIDEGRLDSLLTPAVAVAALLVVGGALGLGLGLGGMSLPRCEAFASRVALIGGGTTAALLGTLIGTAQVLG
jgi:copper transport protein